MGRAQGGLGSDRGIGQKHAVAAAFLGGVERGVGGAQQGIDVHPRKDRGDPQADGETHRPVAVVEIVLGHRGAQTVEVRQAALHRRRSHQDGEFLAADAAEQGVLGQELGADPGEGAQGQVPGGVAVGVVDPLEVVEVGHRQDSRILRIDRSRQNLRRGVEEITAIVNAGVLVVVHQQADLPVLFGDALLLAFDLFRQFGEARRLILGIGERGLQVSGEAFQRGVGLRHHRQVVQKRPLRLAVAAGVDGDADDAHRLAVAVDRRNLEEPDVHHLAAGAGDLGVVDVAFAVVQHRTVGLGGLFGVDAVEDVGGGLSRNIGARAAAEPFELGVAPGVTQRPVFQENRERQGVEDRLQFAARKQPGYTARHHRFPPLPGEDPDVEDTRRPPRLASRARISRLAPAGGRG